MRRLSGGPSALLCTRHLPGVARFMLTARIRATKGNPMDRLGYGAAAHKAHRVGVAIAGLVLLAGAHSAFAQTTPPAGSATDQAPSEAARRAAASPFRFILQNATAPARKPAPAAAPADKRPAALEQAAVQPKPAPAPAKPMATATAAPAAAPQPAPEPVAALSRKPAEPPPVRREIIPVKTDEPRLPPALLRERPSGTVKVHFDIHPDGTTSDVKVLSSSNRALNRPSVDAVQGWKFEPVDEVLTVETELVYNFDK
jgi:TonB family protein